MNKSTTNPSTQVQRLLENFDIEQARLDDAKDVLAAHIAAGSPPYLIELHQNGVEAQERWARRAFDAYAQASSMLD